MNESVLDPRLIVSIGVPSLIAVAGWFLAHWLNARREVTAKRREMRLKGLEANYIRLAMAAQRDLTDEHKLGLEQFFAEIHLYGTPKQIDMAIDLIKALIAKEPKILFHPLLVNMRDSLREELRLERVTADVWWYRFRAPSWSQTLTAAPIAPAAPIPTVDATKQIAPEG